MHFGRDELQYELVHLFVLNYLCYLAGWWWQNTAYFPLIADVKVDELHFRRRGPWSFYFAGPADVKSPGEQRKNSRKRSPYRVMDD